MESGDEAEQERGIWQRAVGNIKSGNLGVLPVVIGEILKRVEGIEFVRFGGEDVVRHKLVQRIVAAYNEYAEKQAPALREARRQQG